MALHIATKSTTYPVEFSIDESPVRVRVTRFSKDALIAFRKEVAKHEKRGTAEEADEAREKRMAAGRAFTEACIRDHVQFEQGDVTNDDGDVVTGEQILSTFYNRQDVINGLASALYAENCLGKEAKKNLRSLGTFSPGSKPSTERAAGDKPGSTAVPAVLVDSAPGVAATDNRDEPRSGAEVS